MSNPFVGEAAGGAVHLRPDAAAGWRHETGYWGAREHTLLVATAGEDSAVLRMEAGVRGEHAVYVGMYGPGIRGGTIGEMSRSRRQSGLYVRLIGEPHFTMLTVNRREPCFEEVYFKTADLTGKTIEIASFGKPSHFDYVRLVPVRRTALAERRKEVVGILDFASEAQETKPRDYEAGATIRNHADSGFSMVMWKAYSVRCEYHTKVGEQRSYSYTDDERRSRPPGTPIDPNRALTGIGALLSRYDTMRQAVEVAHEVGLPIYGWARINNEFNSADQYGPTTPFHLAHPEARQRDRQGAIQPQLSFAFPEVRRHKIEILCEIAGYGMDGMYIDVLRHPPMVSFDLPLVEGFIARTGRDPRDMPNDGDEEWLRFRADAFTQFLRETRAALDKQAGRRLPLWVRTVDQAWRNLVVGCDVERWLAEGLLDGIIFGPHGATATDYPERLDLSDYLRLAREAPHRPKVIGQVWRYGSITQSMALAADLYAQGVDGVALYESEATTSLPALRPQVWRLGYPEYLG